MQMLLGTMLGDGNLDIRNKNPKYTSRHGHNQHSYNCHKYQVLSAFARKPPKLVRNYGYGKRSSLWFTLTSPTFWPIASLCLRAGKKRVTQEWLNKLTWEAVAWWYMDDGSLQLRTAIFNPQGFTQSEVQMLANWLTTHGVSAKASRVRSRHDPSCYYWIVYLTVASTRALVERIRPFVFPEMAYKIALPERLTLHCYWCQKPFEPSWHGQRAYHAADPNIKYCCGRQPCRKRRHKYHNQVLMSKPGKRESKNAKQRTRYASDPSRRKYECEKAARLRAANPERYRAYKRAWRASRKSNSSA